MKFSITNFLRDSVVTILGTIRVGVSHSQMRAVQDQVFFRNRFGCVTINDEAKPWIEF